MVTGASEFDQVKSASTMKYPVVVFWAANQLHIVIMIVKGSKVILMLTS